MNGARFLDSGFQRCFSCENKHLAQMNTFFVAFDSFDFAQHLYKVADVSPIHFRKQSHRSYLRDLNIGFQGLAAWIFRAKSTTPLYDCEGFCGESQILWFFFSVFFPCFLCVGQKNLPFSHFGWNKHLELQKRLISQQKTAPIPPLAQPHLFKVDTPPKAQPEQSTRIFAQNTSKNTVATSWFGGFIFFGFCQDL